MATVIHAAAMIKICYCHKPMIYGAIAHKLLYQEKVSYKSNSDAYAKINHYNLTNLIMYQSINTIIKPFIWLQQEIDATPVEWLWI